MAERTLTVTITGDASRLKGTLASSGADLDSFATRARVMGERLTSAGRKMSLGITLPIMALAKVAFNELAESEKLSAITEAHIKSTGQVANVTAKHVDELTASLLRKTGIDDEVVRTGANMLLTFKNIRNEVGKGNDIFDRATKAALDLSFEFGSVDSAAKGLGKALNDPVKGMAALSRQGITFSKSQQDMIRWLVASGDMLGAQKLILAEVESQVGGTADAYGKTMPGQIGRTIETLKNLGAEILTQIMPALQKLAEIGLVIIGWFRDLPGPVQTTILALTLLLAAAGPIIYILGALSTAVGVFSAALMFLTATPLGLLITSIGILIGVLTALGVDWGAVWAWIKQAAIDAYNFLKPVFDAFVSAIGWIGRAGGDAANALASAWQAIKAAGVAAYRFIKANVIDPLIRIWNGVLSVVNAVKSAIEWLAGNASTVGTDIAEKYSGVEVGKNASGTSHWKGGMTWVGEKGPELMNLPQGSRIWSSPSSMAMAGGGSSPIYLTVSVEPVTGRVMVNEIQALENVAGPQRIGGG